MPTSAAQGGTVTHPKPTLARNPRRLSFEVQARATVAEEEREPLVFTLWYSDAAGERHESPEWEARPWLISDITMMELPNMQEDQNTVALFAIFRQALGDTYDSFHRWINSPEVLIEGKDIKPIIEAFVEEAAGRPTGPS
jgi:hypothetical protein